eukprot:gene7656-9161_t
MSSAVRFSLRAALRFNLVHRATGQSGQRKLFSDRNIPSSREKRPADPAVVKPEVESETNAEKDKAGLDFDFDVEVMKVLKQINAAAEPMVGVNPKFSVEFVLTEPSLTILTGKGSMYLTVDKEQRLLDLQSFLSGAQQYYYDPDEREWLSKNDKHNLRGVITRDLIRHSRGRPNLDDKA